ncbi:MULTISPECIES: putative quinol monooxygenase [Pseudomonas]|uniref:putative quinol monooxygenase n=1 Tax=Pseudomonas TaxID=286 RepID=UPI00071F9069|nr:MULTISPECIES: antibiotic biosynthesis monooxygenase [Pseudomonas]ALQ02635.1 hypothetical protein AK973_2186 [Pseudomonas brassicacearum]
MEKIFGIVHMDIAPGAEQTFRECAQACVEAARKDLTGTTAYEWFLSEDGRSCTVLEIYDGLDALTHHGQMVGHTLAPVMDIAKFNILFAGDVPAALIERMGQRLGKVEYFGERFQGRLIASAPARAGAGEENMIFAVARFSVMPGKEAVFRALAEECFAVVGGNEPDTLGYEWFLNSSGTECLTVDVYRDERALATHMKNAGPIMAKILQVVRSDVKLYGHVSAEMRKRFLGGLGVQFMAPQIQGVMGSRQIAEDLQP